jgi:hypothetical protein
MTDAGFDNAQWTLGKTSQTIALTEPALKREVAVELVRQARHSVRIFSWDLEPDVFDQTVFLDAVKSFGTGSSQGEIRILLQNSDAVMKRGHRLVELGRRLTSKIFIRRPGPEQLDHAENFLLVDDCGYIHHPLRTRRDGVGNFNAPLEARRLQEFFDEAWSLAESDLEMRRLYL